MIRKLMLALFINNLKFSIDKGYDLAIAGGLAYKLSYFDKEKE